MYQQGHVAEDVKMDMEVRFVHVSAVTCVIKVSVIQTVVDVYLVASKEGMDPIVTVHAITAGLAVWRIIVIKILVFVQTAVRWVITDRGALVNAV